MLRIILIRPGSTDYVEQARVHGTLDIPLSERGTEEVARTGEELRDLGIRAVFCSDAEPALSTAKALATVLDVRCRKLDHLQNLDHGLWQGMSVEEIKRKHPKVYRQWQENPDSVCPPSGETLSDARARVHTVLKKFLKKQKEGTVALVVSEPLTSIVRCELQQGALGDLWKSYAEPSGWQVIETELAPATS